MRKILSVLTAACLCLAASFSVGAEGAKNWYLRYGDDGTTPAFPPESEEVSSLGGVYLDGNCSEGEKRIYLTFDAGYENGNIERILDIMKEKEVTGAFFILSNLIDKNPELVKRMADEGHLVCNHTSNHKDVTRLSSDEMCANLAELEAEYRELTGKDMAKLFRFPEGKYDMEKLALCNSLGYRTVFWSLAYDDWDNSRQPTPEAAMKKLLGRTHPGAIILLHPTSETNAKIMGALIDEWRNMGYSFGSLDEL